MLLRVSHETRLNYTAPVSETVFEVRMAPPSNEDQTSMGYNLRISPQAPVTSYRDGFSNRVDLFNVATFYKELAILATSYVRTHRRSGLERLNGVEWPEDGAGMDAIEAAEFSQHSPLVNKSPALTAFVSELPKPSGALAGVVRSLMEAVRNRIKFERKVTSANTPVSEALDLGCGVCQDFAHLFIGACRGVGLPARYVSGYINETGEIATHAWAQFWAGPKVGWVDVDPTRNDFVADGHVLTAVGRDYSDVPPNRGLWKGRAEETMNVVVKVEAIDRIPMEWNEWAPMGLRPGSSSFSQFQSQRMGSSVQTQRSSRSPYPNQRSARSGLHQQQGQQQQQQK
ncbi:transglutaminase family protein [Singulisphaera sp. PoT]|uniref:transglutaminase family protein n=1 Tax=Singulisphaera sp. PoT TaxID=3411797 RepID=UPI003BF56EFA